MELPVELDYSPELYAEVTSTLYPWYGIAGGVVQVATALTIAALAVRVRHSPSGALAFAAAASFILSLALWGALVAPVNSTWAEFTPSSAAEFATAYARLRTRWEFGHVAAFIAWFTGWLCLVAVATRLAATETSGAA